MTRSLHHTVRLLLAALAATVLPTLASAQDASELDQRMCRNGLFAAYGPFQLARVAGEQRAYFLEDMNGCPESADCRLARQPFVVPGDVVLVSRLWIDYACAYYPGENGGTAGYLPLEQLEIIPTATPASDIDWIDAWTGPDSDLIIYMSRAGLRVGGTAFWYGLPTSDGYPVVHDGELDGPLTVFGNRARYDDGFCEVDFTLLDDYLITDDNGSCGGVNVRFVKVYTREEQD